MAADDGGGSALMGVVLGPVHLAGAVLGFGTEAVRQARATLPVVGEVIRTLPRLVVAVERVAAVGPALDALSSASAHLERLAVLADRAVKLSDTEQVRVEVLRALAATTRIAAAASALDPLPEQVEELTRSIGTVADRLGEVEPDLTALARMIAALDESIRVLATAVAPLQGTSERLGRLVDRLPDRRRKQTGGAAS